MAYTHPQRARCASALFLLLYLVHPLTLIRNKVPLTLLFTGVSWLAVGRQEASADATTTDAAAPQLHAKGSATSVPPRPLHTPVRYPRGGTGEAHVELILTLDGLGRVVAVTSTEGEEPFRSAAAEQAPGWLFTPAQRDGIAVSARIRFTVLFAPAAAPNRPPIPSISRAQGTDAPSYQDGHDASPGQPTPTLDVTVSGRRTEPTHTITAAESRQLPGGFGDPFRSVDVLPGVAPVMSGLPYFYLRGAPPGNVAYYFDGVRIPLLYHFAAGPAVVHPAFIGNVEVYSGAYPARWGAASGGIVSGEGASPAGLRRAQLGVRLVDAGAMLELPFAGERGTLMLGGRYSYTGLLLAVIEPDLRLRYWDYQARASYELDHSNRLELLWFGSADLFQERASAPSSAPVSPTPAMPASETARREDDFRTELDLNFHRVDLRWDHHDQGYDRRVALTTGLDETRVDDGGAEAKTWLLGARIEAEHYSDPTLTWRYGGEALGQRVAQDIEEGFGDPPRPGTVGCVDCMGEVPVGMSPELRPNVGDRNYALGFGDRIDALLTAYTDVTWQFIRGATLTPGLRADLYASGEAAVLAIEPRLRARFELWPRLAIVHALGVAHQMPSFELPVPGTNPNLKGGLQRAVQHSAGVETHIGATSFAGVTLFQNLFFDFTDASAIPGDDAVRVDGRSYGVELLLRRTLAKRWGGIVSYTLSRSDRSSGRFSGPASSDRTHVINGAITFSPGNHWLLGARSVLYTGVPARRLVLQPFRRTHPFWRVDWRVEKSWPGEAGRSWRLVFEVLNTTLNEEMVALDCTSAPCEPDYFGPITLPSVGLEATF
jgi:hypothetical protein